jgi:predicted GNAT family acetyltransferase
MSEITNDTAAGQYEMQLGAGTALLTYRMEEGALFLLHTEVPKPERGNGFGDALVRRALEDARAKGMKVVPLCPFVGAYIRRHPEYADLVRDSGG